MSKIIPQILCSIAFACGFLVGGYCVQEKAQKKIQLVQDSLNWTRADLSESNLRCLYLRHSEEWIKLPHYWEPIINAIKRHDVIILYKRKKDGSLSYTRMNIFFKKDGLDTFEYGPYRFR